MPVWVFLDFKDNSGANQIEDWLNGLKLNVRKQVKATLKAKLDIHQHLPELREPVFKPLQGYDKIFEIRFKASRTEWRPLGCYGPERREFTLLVGAKEQNNRFVPRSAPDTAITRETLIMTDRRYVTPQCLLP